MTSGSPTDFPVRRSVQARWFVHGPASAVIAATSLLPGAAHAKLVAQRQLKQPRRLSIEQLSQIQVTSVAERRQSLADASAAIFVMTHQQIIHSGATTG